MSSIWSQSKRPKEVSVNILKNKHLNLEIHAKKNVLKITSPSMNATQAEMEQLGTFKNFNVKINQFVKYIN